MTIPADAAPRGRTLRPARLAAAVGRRSWLVPLLAPCALLLWAEPCRRLLAPGDGLLFYLPLHRLAADALRAGRLPAWNPFQFAGAPLLGSAQSAPYYPAEALFLALSAPLANNLYVVCNFSVAALGAFLLARRLTRDPAAACVAGLAFGSCGFMYGHVPHQSVVAAVAWLPWALNGLERLRERPDVTGVAALAVPLALSFLAGQPQMSVVVVVVLLLYGATQLAVARYRHGAIPGSASRVAGATAVALVAGGGLAAAQLLPVAAILGDTNRATFSFQDATSYSFPGSHVVLVLFPLLFGSSQDYRGQFNLTELSAYPGAAALVLAAIGFARARRDMRFIGLSVAAAVAFFAALGKTTLFGWLVYALPVLGHFRSWGRYAIVLDLAVAVGAAYGVATLRSRQGRVLRTGLAAVAALVAIGLLVPLLPPVARYAVSGGERVHAVLAPTGAALAAVGCAALFRTRPALAVAACALLVVADGLVSFGLGTEMASSPTVRTAEALYSPRDRPAWGRVIPVPGGVARYLYLGKKVEPVLPAFPQATDLKGLRSANGSDPLAPAAYLDAVGMRQDGGTDHPGRLLKRPSWTLDLLRVSTVLVPRARASHGISARLARAGETHRLVRYRYVPRLADAFLVGRALDASHGAAVAALRNTTGFDPRREALLEGCRGCREASGSGPAGVVRSERREAGTITLDVAARRPAALVVSEAWFPGWRASVDGRTEPVLRADGLVLGLLIPAGRHHVRLRYVAPGAAAGGLISLAFVLAFAGIGGVSWRRRHGRARFGSNAQRKRS